MKVLFEKRNHIAYVTINRPERLNACDFEDLRAAGRNLDRISRRCRPAGRHPDRRRRARLLRR